MCTYVSVLERPDQGFLIDDLPPRRVDDDRPLLQRPYHLLAHKPLRALIERHMHTQHVRLREHLVEPLEREVFAPCGCVRDGSAVVVDDAHGEGVAKFSEAKANATEAENSNGAACRVMSVARVEASFPLSCADVAFGLGKLTKSRHEQV